MFLASCPLRISLFGGSTDNPMFIEKYKYGSVISLTCNLKTYITLHKDLLGYNVAGGFYVVNYSKREEVKKISEIKNDPIRVVLEHFKLDPVNISMTSDAYSQGSGLASSSSYMIGLIKAISLMKKLNLDDIQICNLAYELELSFNPFCGYQDPYGCGVGGFKRIEFENGGIIKYNFIDSYIFEYFDMHLVFTGVVRSSIEVLKKVTENIDKSKPLLRILEKAYLELKNKNYDDFVNLIKDSWEEKKKTTEYILKNKNLKNLDDYLAQNASVKAHKLCGAGNGGFFLVFSEKNKLDIDIQSVKISVEPNGVMGTIL